MPSDDSQAALAAGTVDARSNGHQPAGETAINTPTPTLKTVFSQRTSRLTGVQMLGIGTHVPDNVITNEDLERERGFDPEWIEKRTGILERRHAEPGTATSDLCVEAARKAMATNGVYARDIDLVVVGTFTPDYLCPSTANLVQYRLGIDAPAFDVSAACSGFVYALSTAAQYVATGNSKLALVIGGDCNSRIVDQTDRRIAPLFGDGAGAVLLGKGSDEQGFLRYQMGSDGSGAPMLDRSAGGSLNPYTTDSIIDKQHLLNMDGRNVFKWAVRAVAETIRIVLAAEEMSVHDPSIYMLHQANIRIVDAACDQLGISPDKVFNNLQKYGNTSAATIPLLIDEALEANRLNRGDTILMSGFGAGLTWGTGLFRY